MLELYIKVLNVLFNIYYKFISMEVFFFALKYKA